jgi:hypothetical protein
MIRCVTGTGAAFCNGTNNGHRRAAGARERVAAVVFVRPPQI